MNDNTINFRATFSFDDEHTTDIYFSNKWEAAKEMVELFSECECEQGKLTCINFSRALAVLIRGILILTKISKSLNRLRCGSGHCTQKRCWT